MCASSPLAQETWLEQTAASKTAGSVHEEEGEGCCLAREGLKACNQHPLRQGLSDGGVGRMGDVAAIFGSSDEEDDIIKPQAELPEDALLDEQAPPDKAPEEPAAPAYPAEEDGDGYGYQRTQPERPSGPPLHFKVPFVEPPGARHVLAGGWRLTVPLKGLAFTKFRAVHHPALVGLSQAAGLYALSVVQVDCQGVGREIAARVE